MFSMIREFTMIREKTFHVNNKCLYDSRNKLMIREKSFWAKSNDMPDLPPRSKVSKKNILSNVYQIPFLSHYRSYSELHKFTSGEVSWNFQVKFSKISSTSNSHKFVSSYSIFIILNVSKSLQAPRYFLRIWIVLT